MTEVEIWRTSVFVKIRKIVRAENKTANITVKKLYILKRFVLRRQSLDHTTKTAKIKKVILLVSTLTIWQCAAK